MKYKKDHNFIRIQLLDVYETSLVMEKTLNLSSSVVVQMLILSAFV